MVSESHADEIPHPARPSALGDVKAGLVRRQALIINTPKRRQAFTCFSSGRPAGKRDDSASEGGGGRRRRWTKGSPLGSIGEREHLPPLNLAT